jgi:hypothetical protein
LCTPRRGSTSKAWPSTAACLSWQVGRSSATWQLRTHAGSAAAAASVLRLWPSCFPTLLSNTAEAALCLPYVSPASHTVLLLLLLLALSYSCVHHAPHAAEQHCRGGPVLSLTCLLPHTSCCCCCRCGCLCLAVGVHHAPHAAEQHCRGGPVFALHVSCLTCRAAAAVAAVAVGSALQLCPSCSPRC